MNLYLFRHGEAEEAEDWDGPDATRPLTRTGEKVTEAVARALKRRKARVSEIWTSPLVRAVQTAKIIGSVFGVHVKEVAALAAGASSGGIVGGLEGAPDRVMLVGHEPDLGRLVGVLAGEGGEEYPFKKSGTALLAGKPEPGGMKLEWQYRPKDLTD